MKTRKNLITALLGAFALVSIMFAAACGDVADGADHICQTCKQHNPGNWQLECAAACQCAQDERLCPRDGGVKSPPDLSGPRITPLDIAMPARPDMANFSCHDGWTQMREGCYKNGGGKYNDATVCMRAVGADFAAQYSYDWGGYKNSPMCDAMECWGAVQDGSCTHLTVNDVKNDAGAFRLTSDAIDGSVFEGGVWRDWKVAVWPPSIDPGGCLWKLDQLKGGQCAAKQANCLAHLTSPLPTL